MTAPAPKLPDRLLDAYRDAVAASTGASRAGVDELLRATTSTDNAYAALTGSVDSLTLGGLLAARADAARLVEDDGITYGQGSDGRVGRGWVIDPLPLIIGSGEWTEVEAGVAQRARLLDALHTDLYGERRLLQGRRLPAELVLAHDGFLPAVDGIRHPGTRQVLLTGTDIARGADGRWVALGDRTQVPSGSGYAMANRRITARVMAGLHRRSPLVRLRGWFDDMAQALQAIAPSGVDLPRVVVLSPGSTSETAFEMAFLSTLLGFPIVESEDLTTRGGRVSIRARDRIEKVDVLLRRVDADFSDPLDLRPESRLGVTGLVESARLGNISIANPLGSAVLENPALHTYLPTLARDLLDEDLLLPGPQTWWCGDPVGRAHVINNLESLVLKPISRRIGPNYFGWELDAAAREELRARIAARPWQWVGQAPVSVSTAPIVRRGGLEPRSVIVRTFTVANGREYAVLPGGLARLAALSGQQSIANTSGAITKDVWVLARPGGETPLVDLDIRRPRLLPERVPVGLAARVADNLFWMGRYAERAESTARLLRVADDLAEDHAARPHTPGEAAMRLVVGALDALTGAANRSPSVLAHLRSLLIDESTPGTVAWSTMRLVLATYEVRDQLSLDTWIVLGRLERALRDIPGDEEQLQPQLGRLLESLLAVAGITSESMVRDATWAFIQAGARLERAMTTAALLRLTLGFPGAPLVEGQVAESVLSACESIITHRRRAASGFGPTDPAQSAVAIVALDPSNPRSVAYQVAELQRALTLIDDAERQADLDLLAAQLHPDRVDDLFADERKPLRDLLSQVETTLRSTSEDIARRHFARKAPQHNLPLAWSSARQVPR